MIITYTGPVVGGRLVVCCSGLMEDSCSVATVITLDLSHVVSRTKYLGEFEGKLQKIMEEVRESNDLILFIDEVHMVVGAGAVEGGVDAANILEPALARGKLQCIGATTLDEYIQHIEKDPAFERRFQPVEVPEPTVGEAIQILRGLRERYENMKYTTSYLILMKH